MNVDPALLTAINLANMSRRWDKYLIYAVCLERSSGRHIRDYREQIPTVCFIKSVTGIDPNEWANLVKIDGQDKVGFFEFNRQVWSNLEVYSVFKPVDKLLLSLNLGIAAQVVKKLVFSGNPERVIARAQWGEYVHAFVNSLEMQLEALVEDIEQAIPKNGTYVAGISALFTGTPDNFQYVRKLRAIAEVVKSCETQPERKEHPRNYIKGW